MFNPRPNLLCRVGIHRWTADQHQGDNQSEISWEHYCLQCHIDRFALDGIPATSIDRFIDAIYIPAAKLHYRIQSRIHQTPKSRYARPSCLPHQATVLPAQPKPEPDKPILIAFITVRSQPLENPYNQTQEHR